MRTKQRNFGRLAYTIKRRTERRMGELCVGVREKRFGLWRQGQATGIKGREDGGRRYDYVTVARELERAGASLWRQSRFGQEVKTQNAPTQIAYCVSERRYQEQAQPMQTQEWLMRSLSGRQCTLVKRPKLKHDVPLPITGPSCCKVAASSAS